MNNNILIPPDTTTASLKEKPNCNTIIKLIIFSVLILNIPSLPIVVILKDTEFGV